MNIDRRVVDYETVGAESLEVLDIEVGRAIRDGWQPFGSLAISQHGDECNVHWTFVQPMVLYSDHEKQES